MREKRMIEKEVNIPTRDGLMRTFITHPDRDQPHPVVIVYQDARGIREELRDMTRRLATVGYYCLLPHLYYRWDGGISFNPEPIKSIPSDNEKVLALIAKTTSHLVISDTAAVLQFLKSENA